MESPAHLDRNTHAALGIRKEALKDTIKPEESIDLLKRTFDIAFSGLVIVFIAPLLLAIAIAVKIDSSGPALL